MSNHVLNIVITSLYVLRLSIICSMFHLSKATNVPNMVWLVMRSFIASVVSTWISILYVTKSMVFFAFKEKSWFPRLNAKVGFWWGYPGGVSCYLRLNGSTAASTYLTLKDLSNSKLLYGLRTKSMWSSFCWCISPMSYPTLGWKRRFWEMPMLPLSRSVGTAVLM